MQKAIRIIPVLLIYTLAACSAQPSPVADPVSAPDNTPLTATEVPRVSVEDARKALESGAAVMVDVRDPRAFESRHIAGAISVPLGEIEQHPADLPFERDQWIITYCT
jgi:3-mercaptopyruvate sulfurtransferase SseA